MSTKNKVVITLLAHGHPEMTLRCLERLRKNTHYPYTLIFVDNGSEWPDYDTVATSIELEYSEAIIIRNEENLYYAGGTNVGLRAAMGIPDPPDYVIALSNDVFVSPGWLKKLVYLAERNPRVGVLSPLTDNISRTCVNAEWVVRRWKIQPPSAPLSNINKLRARLLRCQGNVPLFCAMIRAEVLADVGYLHEAFFILGNDDDYNDRVRTAGYLTAAALNIFVEHLHGATKHELFPKPERAVIRARHKALLAERKAYRQRTGDYRS